MLPALLHSIALLVSLLVQATNSVFAGAWLMFHLLACTVLLYRNTYSKGHSALWRATVAWLVTILIAAFLINPVSNGAYWCAVLTTTPLLAISLTEKDLYYYAKGFGIVLGIYAVLLIAQYFIPIGPKVALSGRVAWPLLDPNNAACMMNFALIPCLFKRRWMLACLFGMALYATGSKTGIAAGSTGGLILLSSLWGEWVWLAALLSGCAAGSLLFFYCPQIIVSFWQCFASRFAGWWEAWELGLDNPWRGIGLGRFQNYLLWDGKDLWRTPTYVHNDLMQFAVEMGTPAALVFVALLLSALKQASKANLVTGCTLMAVMLQASMEFQFYIPSVALCAGLALGWHNLNDGSRQRARPAGQFRFNGLS